MRAKTKYKKYIETLVSSIRILVSMKIYEKVVLDEIETLEYWESVVFVVMPIPRKT